MSRPGLRQFSSDVTAGRPDCVVVYRAERLSPSPLAQAHRWQELLDTGQVASINELAKELNVDPSYVGCHLRLALLAPDVAEAILAGTEPSGLSLAKLTKPFPLLWDEQRECFGFPLPGQATC